MWRRAVGCAVAAPLAESSRRARCETKPAQCESKVVQCEPKAVHSALRPAKEVRRRWHHLLANKDARDQMLGRAALSARPHQAVAYHDGRLFPVYSAAEVAATRDTDQVWTTFGDGVYDVTKFAKGGMHPGLEEYIMWAHGMPLEPFWATYPQHKEGKVLRLLEEMRVGVLAEEDRLTRDDVDDPYEDEPVRDQRLRVLSKQPFDAETPAAELRRHRTTDAAAFFVRNHHPVPHCDERHTVQFVIPAELASVKVTEELNLEALREFPHREVEVTLACTGNRAQEMTGSDKDSSGKQLGNATFRGVALRDVLRSFGLDDDVVFGMQATRYPSPGWHVHLLGADGYGVSMPLELACRIDRDVLLAFDMNGEPLLPDHGYPVRIVAPGCVGARSVKWITQIAIHPYPAQTPWQRIYCVSDRSVPSAVFQVDDAESSTPCLDAPLNSLILEPEPGMVSVQDNLTVRGVALPSGGRQIIKVEASLDGVHWRRAELDHRPAPWGRAWSWTPWTVKFSRQELHRAPRAGAFGHRTIKCRAIDDSYTCQPENLDQQWNMRGYLNHAYHSVTVECDFGAGISKGAWWTAQEGGNPA